MAQCSESTGTISAPGVRRARRTTGAPAMIDSLLARASVRPASRAAKVTVRPAKPTTPLTATSASVAMCGEPVGPRDHLGALWHPAGELDGERGVADGHHVGPEPVGLLGQEVHRPVGSEGHDREALGGGLDDLDRLGPDGAGGADQADRGGSHLPSLPDIHPIWRARTR